MWGAQGWNQWALQPAMYNDVPHEQIDWAALAKQWIQMQQSQPPDSVEPSTLQVPPTTASTVIQNAIPPPPGHAPVPEEYPLDPSINIPPLLIKAPAPAPEAFPNDRTFDVDPATFVPKTVNNTYWNKSQWEAAAPGEVDDRMWSAPPVDPLPAVMGTKETFDYGHMHDNPPIAMQSIDYNHMSEFPYNQVYPAESQYDQYWSQVNAAPPVAPIFLKKERSSTTSTTASVPVEEDMSQIDSAKRKQLPAWIREGLEKMEQERLKKIQKEKASKERAEKLAKEKLNSSEVENKPDHVIVKSKFDSDSDADDDPTLHKVDSPITKRSPSPIEDLRTEEEKRQELILRIRRLLTELLLTVTNEEMHAVAQEVINKERLKARQLASSASLTSLASGLRSLASYGSESEASGSEEEKAETDSDEELRQRIKEKRRLFALKEKKILAELEKKELEEQNSIKAEIENPDPVHSKLENLEQASNQSSSMTNVKIENQVTDPVSTEILASSNNETVLSTLENKERKEHSSKETKKSNNKEAYSSHSGSSSSENESESSEKHKKRSNKSKHHKKERERTTSSRRESPTRKRHKHGKSSDSDSSDKAKKHKSRGKDSNYKKKKKYKRSDSSSSSDSSYRRKYGHSRRDRRSHSYDDREKRLRSSSPRSYRSTDRSRDSYSHKYEKEKYSRRERSDRYYYEHTRSPSPHRSSKLPKKYRCSRSLSSESEYSGKKSKKSRNH